ncbi:MAG TPA: hypothetical protein V6D43_01355 [Candidatus Sericytochromatia bacterium]|jgi:hypothetical protein
MNSTNFRQACALPSTLLELFAEVIQQGKITFSHRYTMRTALLSPSLTEDEKDSINRLLYSVRRGLVKVVDES